MNISLYQAAAAMNATSRWQEAISENLASSAVPGYKKQEVSFAAAAAGLLPRKAALDKSYALPSATLSRNFSLGQFKPTGVQTDVAIEGDGFFEVQMPSGQAAYTRDGEFHLNAQGEVVTKDGYSVIGSSGRLLIDPAHPAPISISSTGEISQGTTLVGKLKLVRFNNTQLLTPASGGYFLASNPDLQTTPSTAPVRQGFLEGANTSAVLEMANLMMAMRSFEANQRVIQLQDQRMGQAISDLGNPNS